MKINRNNYEPYFIDYLEGNLDENLVDDFIEFLTSNPDLKEELSLFEPVSVEPGEVVFGKKNQLYKERFDLESEFSENAIANLEGDLSAPEKAAFEKYIANHPERKRDLELFEKTKLVADESIVFVRKNDLYKTSILKTLFYWSGRVAAVLVVAFLVYFFVDQIEKPKMGSEPVVANQENKMTEEQQTVSTPAKENNNQQQFAKAEKPKAKVAGKQEEKLVRVQPEEKTEQNQAETEVLAFAENEQVHFTELTPVFAAIEPEMPEATLETMYITIPQAEPYDERLLVDVVKEKTGIEKISINKITKAGLNLFASISKEKFSYQTDESGKVTEIIYDSRLLAFTIPTTRNTERTEE